MSQDPSLYQRYTRQEWSALREATPLTLGDSDLESLRGINDRLDMAEVTDVYLPLSRLLNLHVAATQQLSEVTTTFVGKPHAPIPYVVGIAGSVAVGKSTTARVLQTLLARWPHHPKVDLVTTDGFLLSNRKLEERNLMHRKGFPDSYDQAGLISFLGKVKAGAAEVGAPVYSHTEYDIIPDQLQLVHQPDVLIIEGLNVLQVPESTQRSRTERRQPSQSFVSDFFDFSIYVDAQEDHIEQWYVDRFLTLCQTVFQDDRSFFHRYSELSTDEAVSEARSIWTAINGPNLHENIAPTKERADLILSKQANHSVDTVLLRKN